MLKTRFFVRSQGAHISICNHAIAYADLYAMCYILLYIFQLEHQRIQSALTNSNFFKTVLNCLHETASSVISANLQEYDIILIVTLSMMSTCIENSLITCDDFKIQIKSFLIIREAQILCI